MDLGTVSNNLISGALPDPSAVSYTERIERLISIGLGTVTIVAGVSLLLMLAWGGFEYISGAGDEKAQASAKKTITSALTGLIIAVASMTIATIVLKIFGLDIKALPWFA